MKQTFQRAELLSAMQAVAPIVPGRTNRPILANVLIDTVAGPPSLVGTDGECSIRVEIPQPFGAKYGKALLPCARTIEILRSMSGDSVTIEVTDKHVRIDGNGAEYKLGLEYPEMYPPVPQLDLQDGPHYVVDAADLRRCLRRTAFAADTDRFALGGVLLDFRGVKNGLELAVVATDTRRLAVSLADCIFGRPEDSDPSGCHPIVPARAVSLILKSLADFEGQVRIAVRINEVLVSIGSTLIVSRCLEGQFPNYATVIPGSYQYRVQLQVGDFLAAVRQARIVTSEESRGVRFEFGSTELGLTSKSAEVGESEVYMRLPQAGEPGPTILLDPGFLADFLRSIDPEWTIWVELTDGDSAAVLRTEDGSIYLQMPLSDDP